MLLPYVLQGNRVQVHEDQRRSVVLAPANFHDAAASLVTEAGGGGGATVTPAAFTYVDVKTAQHAAAAVGGGGDGEIVVTVPPHTAPSDVALLAVTCSADWVIECQDRLPRVRFLVPPGLCERIQTLLRGSCPAREAERITVGQFEAFLRLLGGQR